MENPLVGISNHLKLYRKHAVLDHLQIIYTYGESVTQEQEKSYFKLD